MGQRNGKGILINPDGTQSDVQCVRDIKLSVVVYAKGLNTRLLLTEIC